ncbi:Gfo/Idh/MocA family oxidoreductase [bacterium]|nr:Gfo/Idh/MocA family oxidoreductase [bacterium]
MSQAKPGTDRRSFLKKSTVAAAGASLATGLMQAQASAFVGGNDTVKIGLIGCGGRGTGAATQALNTDGPTKLVAMADAFDDRLEQSHKNIKKQHGDKVEVPKDRRFTGWDAYTKVLDQDIDMVILATPPGFRPVHFEAAVNAGKHVFAEKPLAVDPAGVRKVLAASRVAKEKNLLVQIGLQRRHERRYMETMKRLHDGAIGDIVLSRAYWNGGGVWVRPRKDGQTEMEYQMRNWYYFNWLCGDHINEQHIHNLDVINWLKKGFPVKAQGMGGREVRTGIDHGEIYDHHFVEFTYADGSKMFSQCRHIPGTWRSVSEAAHGTNGWADISGCKIYNADGSKNWEYGKGGGGGHQQEHHDLFADLRKGVIPNEGEYGAMSTMTAILGRMATYSGKEIKMEDALASELVISPAEKYTSYDDTPPTLPNDEGRYKIPVPGKTKVM